MRAARAVRGSAARVNARLSAKRSANIVILLRGVARAALRALRTPRAVHMERALRASYGSAPFFGGTAGPNNILLTSVH